MNSEDFEHYIKTTSNLELLNEFESMTYDEKEFTEKDVKNYIRNNEYPNKLLKIIKKQKYNVLLKRQYPDYEFLNFDDEYYDVYELIICNKKKDISITYKLKYKIHEIIIKKGLNNIIYKNIINRKKTEFLFDLDYLNLLNMHTTNHEIIEYLAIFKYFLQIKDY